MLYHYCIISSDMNNDHIMMIIFSMTAIVVLYPMQLCHVYNLCFFIIIIDYENSTFECYVVLSVNSMRRECTDSFTQYYIIRPFCNVSLIMVSFANCTIVFAMIKSKKFCIRHQNRKREIDEVKDKDK